jgi:predicted glycogen debranching enzyme
LRPREEDEWIETDGRGGFASGTAALIRNRRYHALLLAPVRPPAGRMVLVNGLEAWLETPSGKYALSSQRYTPGVIYPDGTSHISAFAARPWPRWEFELPDGTRLEHGILIERGRSSTLAYWRLIQGTSAVLTVRPLMSGRDYHSLHHENPAFNFYPEIADGRVIVRPYAGVPAAVFSGNGEFTHEPDWYRNFLYENERERGLDFVEDLASPGTFRFDLAAHEAFLTLSADGQESDQPFIAIRAEEKRRRSDLAAPMLLAADQFIVRRNAGSTIIAGYPWFTDWGRDTFISMRGLCLATGRHEEARAILLQWSTAVSEGMLPNRFPDAGEQPEYNSVDASLWFIVAVHDFLQAAPVSARSAAEDRQALQSAVETILEGYSRGTRFGIQMDPDGLLMCGQPGVQITWMDAKVGDWVVTPRIGKPVEVQVLWLNALRIASRFSERWAEPLAKASASFEQRFFDAERGYLYDVVDNDRQPGAIDRAMRPNQIFAVGGLPYSILQGARAQSVVEAVETHLLTPVGLRTLAPDDPGYKGHYQGGVRERDGAYHQGTVWPWLMGPFVEAWLRVNGETRKAKDDARARFLTPMLQTLDNSGSGQLPEIADGDPPHTARGCPFQAWSVGEALRLDRILR